MMPCPHCGMPAYTFAYPPRFACSYCWLEGTSGMQAGERPIWILVAYGDYEPFPTNVVPRLVESRS